MSESDSPIDAPNAGEFLQAMEAIEFQLERCADAMLLQAMLLNSADLSGDLLSINDYDAVLAELVRRQLVAMTEAESEESTQ